MTPHVLARVRRALPNGASLPENLWRRRHRAILSCSGCTCRRSCSSQSRRELGIQHALFEGSLVGILAATAILAGRLTRNRHLLGTLVALGLLTSSATIVHLSGGAIEAHFHFFVMMSVLLLYEDWLPYAAAFGYVVLHHGTLGVAQPGERLQPRRALCPSVALGNCPRPLHHRCRHCEHRQLATQRHRSQRRSGRVHACRPERPALRGRFRQRADRRRPRLPDGRWLHVNQALLQILGYSRAAAARNGLPVDHPPGDPRHATSDFLRRVSSGEIDSYEREKRYFHANGRMIWIGAGSRARSRRGRRTAVLHRADPGHHQPTAARGAVPAVAEDGGGRPARGRCRARLQQPPDRHLRLQRARAPARHGRGAAPSDDVRDELEEIKSAAAEPRR